MLRYRSITTIFLLWIISSDYQAQNVIKGRRNVIAHSDNINQKANPYIKIPDRVSWQKPDSTLYYLKKFKNLVDITQYPEDMLEIEYNYGMSYKANRDYELALPHFKESYKISSLISDSTNIARAGYQCGILNLYIGHMKESIKYLSLSHKYYSELDMTNEVAILNNALGHYYLNNHDISKAIDRFDIALRTYEQLNDSLGMSNVYANLGMTYIDVADHKKAEHHLDALCQRDTLMNTQYHSGFQNESMSYLKQSEKKYIEALSLYQKTIDVKTKLSRQYNISKSYLIMGEVLLKLAKYREAVTYASEILKNIDDHKSLYQEQSVHRILALCYEKLGQQQHAIGHYQKYKSITDSIYSKDKKTTLSKSEARFKKNDRDREIDFIKKEKEIAELKMGKQKLILWSTIISIIFLTIISLIIAKLYQIIKDKNEVISSTMKDKDILLREIHHRVKNNLQVILSLLSLQSRQLSNVHAQQAINEGRNRVRTMALIHQNLYQKENLTGVHVHVYLQKLISELLNTYSSNQNKVSLILDIDTLSLDVDTMIPLGFVINELISHCLKHAFFRKENSTITVSLKESESRLILKVSDDGASMQKNDLDPSKSFGNRLINVFSQKLKAELSYNNSSGTQIQLIINNYQKAA